MLRKHSIATIERGLWVAHSEFQSFLMRHCSKGCQISVLLKAVVRLVQVDSLVCWPSGNWISSFLYGHFPITGSRGGNLNKICFPGLWSNLNQSPEPNYKSNKERIWILACEGNSSY